VIYPALIVTDVPEANIVKSTASLAGFKVVPAGLLNVIDLLSYRRLLMTVAAVHKVEELWGRRRGRCISMKYCAAPVITEKNTGLVTQNKYAFEVAGSSE